MEKDVYYRCNDDVYIKQRTICFQQVDLSKKGSFDEKLLQLINALNNSQNYYTTSSCSGRVYLFEKVKWDNTQYGKRLYLEMWRKAEY